jgi:hypothetical protein
MDIRAARIGLRNDGGILGGPGFQLLELQFHLVDQLATTFGGGSVLVVPEFGDHQLEMCHHRLGTGGTSASRRAICSAASAARRVSISSEPMSGAGVTAMIGSQAPVVMHGESTGHREKLSRQPAISGRHVRRGCRQSIPSSI